MILDENPEVQLIRLSEEKDEALKKYGIAYAFLHDCYSKYLTEIQAITGKKFVGNDSRADVVLDWAYQQPKETKDLIVEMYQQMVISGKKSEGLSSRYEALSQAMHYTTCKWKQEREMTK